MHQYLFFIGIFPIRMYGLMLCTAIFMATGTAYFLAYKDGRGWEKYLPDIGIYGGFAGIVGARLWDVFFFDWAYYSDHLSEIFFVWQGGMAIQGGIVGGILAGALYCRAHKINWIDMLDVISPALFIGQSIGRMANLLNGDAFGAPTGGDFGILYPVGTLARSTYGNAPLWPAEVWEGQIDVILSHCSSYSSPGLTNAASAAFFTSCSTRRCAFSLNSSAAIMWSPSFLASNQPRQQA